MSVIALVWHVEHHLRDGVVGLIHCQLRRGHNLVASRSAALDVREGHEGVVLARVQGGLGRFLGLVWADGGSDGGRQVANVGRRRVILVVRLPRHPSGFQKVHEILLREVVYGVVGDAKSGPGDHGDVVGLRRVRHAVVIRQLLPLRRPLGEVGVGDGRGVVCVLKDDDVDAVEPKRRIGSRNHQKRCK